MRLRCRNWGERPSTDRRNTLSSKEKMKCLRKGKQFSFTAAEESGVYGIVGSEGITDLIITALGTSFSHQPRLGQFVSDLHQTPEEFPPLK